MKDILFNVNSNLQLLLLIRAYDRCFCVCPFALDKVRLHSVRNIGRSPRPLHCLASPSEGKLEGMCCATSRGSSDDRAVQRFVQSVRFYTGRRLHCGRLKFGSSSCGQEKWRGLCSEGEGERSREGEVINLVLVLVYVKE